MDGAYRIATMKKLFQNLVWPAAAGNVAWAFFTVAVQETWAARGVAARLAMLLLLAVYLALDWMKTESELDRLKRWYWIADTFHVAAIVAFAIAIQMNTQRLTCFMAAGYSVTVVGHLAGAWEPTGEVRKRWRNRVLLSGISMLGLVIILVLPYVLAEGSLWHLPIAIGSGVILWSLLRNRVYGRWTAA
jgi:hypothetical protein